MGEAKILLFALLNQISVIRIFPSIGQKLHFFHVENFH